MRDQLIQLVEYVKSLYPGMDPVPLHAPQFAGREKEYLAECIDSTYVSYVGPFVTELERLVCGLTGSAHAVAMVNGTAAIQMALVSAGIRPGDLVITQALTFAATANAIAHSGGVPAFVDVDRDTMGMSAEALSHFLDSRAERGNGSVFDRETGRRIFAIMPMHTFGFAARIGEIASLCADWGISVIEDSAESIGTRIGARHSGTSGLCGVLSFNGNKPVTTGGGGALFTDDAALAERARYISTTAKRKHRWEFFHDELGWNLRMPNINAAIGCAQLERLEDILADKRETARLYSEWCASAGVEIVAEREGTRANYWLNALILADAAERDEFLQYSNDNGVQTRPAWTLMHRLPMYAECPRGPLNVSEWLSDRIVNIPSGERAR